MPPLFINTVIFTAAKYYPMTGPGPSSSEDIPAMAADRARTAFFHDLTRWREQLARSIARNNLALHSGGIAAVTNRIIFSLLFLRIAEDRRLIAAGSLQEIHDHQDPYGRLLEVTGPLSTLWEDPAGTSPNDIIPMGTVVLDKRVVHAVLSRLVSPDRPYRLDEMETEIIAAVLAQYLSRTLRRSAAHHAVVVDTHDTVLSCGAPPPPLPVIRYLAESSLRAAGAGRSRREVLPLRILDPACGAGITLLCAGRILLAGKGGGRLTYDERYEVLTGSVYGVDISPHAVAAAKILLFFLLCEDCCGEVPVRAFLDRAGSVSRDLRHTIRCGNAIIGPDVVDDESWAFCPVRERHALTAFAWTAEFPEIFSAGGFDAVIGNPPAGLPEQKEWIQRYLQRHYEVYDPGADRSFFFVEKGLSLIRAGGTLAMCTGDSWLHGRPAAPLRALLACRQVEEIVDIPASQGGDGSAGICIFRLTRQSPSHTVRVAVIDPAFSGSVGEYVRARSFPVDRETLGEGGWVLRDSRAEAILEKVRKTGTPLEEYVMGQVSPGGKIIPDPAFVIDGGTRKMLIARDQRCRALVRPVVEGDQIGRYEPAAFVSYAVVIPRGWTARHPEAGSRPWRWFRTRHPALARLLKERTGIREVPGNEGDLWWETGCEDDAQRERSPQVLFRERFDRPAFMYDDGRGIAGSGAVAIRTSGPYLAGLLNSRLIAFVFAKTAPASGRERAEHSWDDLRDLPIYTPDFDDPADADRHDRIVSLVTRLVALKKQRSHAETGQERETLRKKIDAADRKIDRIAYGLYGLTPEEITVVESAMPEKSPS